PMGPPPPPPLITALDANHDGVIDAQEIENAPAALRTLDKNKDGKLTPDEYRPPRPGPGGRGPGNGGDDRNRQPGRPGREGGCPKGRSTAFRSCAATIAGGFDGTTVPAWAARSASCLARSANATGAWRSSRRRRQERPPPHAPASSEICPGRAACLSSATFI